MKQLKKLLIFVALILMLSGTVLSYQVTYAEEEKYFFKVTLTNQLGFRSAHMEPLAEFIPQQLAKIGIEVESVWLERAAFREVYWGHGGKTYEQGGMDFLMEAPGTSVPYIKTAIFWFSQDAQVHGTNVARWTTGRYEYLLQKSLGERDPEKFAEICEEMIQICFDDQPWVALWNPALAYPMKSTVEGFAYNPPMGYSRLIREDTRFSDKTEADDTTLIVAIQVDRGEYCTPFTKGGIEGAMMWDSAFVRGLEGFDAQLVKSWEISDDGLTWTVHIHENIKWHDGVPMTAIDFEFTWGNLMLNPEFGGYEAGSFEGWNSVVALDNFTFQINLDTPVPEVIMKRVMEDIGNQAAPYHIMKDVGLEDWGTHWMNTGIGGTPIGNGPFKFVKHVADQYVEFEAFDDYYQGRPFIDHLFLKIIPDPAVALVALETGEVDIVTHAAYTRELAAIDANPDLKAPLAYSTNYNSIMFNTEHPIFNNKYVRWAVSYAMPREQIVEEIAFGLGRPMSVSAAWTSPYFPDDLTIPYDLDKAKEMMEKAGYDYEWLEPVIEPDAPNLYTPALIGLVIGVAATALILQVIKKK